MYGGYENGCFFFIQASEFDAQHRDSLPEYNPTPEEVESGLTGLSEDFGFSSLLFHESEKMSIAPDYFLQKWSAQEFYLLVKFHAWEAHAEKRYDELMRLKQK